MRERALEYLKLITATISAIRSYVAEKLFNFDFLLDIEIKE